jgi:hypothetical protein
MQRVFWLIIIVLSLISCNDFTEEELAAHPVQVGHIETDIKLDDPTFKACTSKEIYQHYNMKARYKGEKPALIEHFSEKLNSGILKKENGYVTIRFLVNCKGETGRYRVKGMDFNYKIKKFDQPTIKQLLNLTKKLNGWPAFENFNYYQNLTFKIVNSQIEEILP